MQSWNLKLFKLLKRRTAVAPITSGELTGIHPVASNVELATPLLSVEILVPMVSTPNHRSAAVRDALILREILQRYPPTRTLQMLRLYPRLKARRPWDHLVLEPNTWSHSPLQRPQPARLLAM
jgi:hypothetical protein